MTWIKTTIKEVKRMMLEDERYQCEECGGEKMFPPCDHIGCYAHITHPCEGCGRMQGVCPTCSGTGINPNIDPAELLMAVNLELCKAWETWEYGRQGLKRLEIAVEETAKALNVTELKAFELSYRAHIQDTAEDHLSKAVINLCKCCAVWGIEPERFINEGYGGCGHLEAGEALFLITAKTCNLFNVDEEPVSYAQVISMILNFCAHHSIPIEKHVEARLAYDKAVNNGN